MLLNENVAKQVRSEVEKVFSPIFSETQLSVILDKKKQYVSGLMKILQQL